MRDVWRFTTAQVAVIIDRDPSTIREHARRYGIGKLFTPRLRMYSDHDLTRLKQLANTPPGRKKKR